jgi:hypothetical protein
MDISRRSLMASVAAGAVLAAMPKQAEAGFGSSPISTTFASSPSGGGTFTTSGANTIGAGLIVILCTQYGADMPGVLSDSQANVWTPRQVVKSASQSSQATIYYCQNPATSSSHTFTLTIVGASNIYGNMQVQAWAGAAAIAADVQTGVIAASATSVTFPSITPTNPRSLIVAGLALGTGGTGTFAINDSFTAFGQTTLSGGKNIGSCAAYLVQPGTSPSTISPTWSWTGSSDVAAVIAVFQPATTSPPPSTYTMNLASTMAPALPPEIIAMTSNFLCGNTGNPKYTAYLYNSSTNSTNPMALLPGTNASSVAITFSMAFVSTTQPSNSAMNVACGVQTVNGSASLNGYNVGIARGSSQTYSVYLQKISALGSTFTTITSLGTSNTTLTTGDVYTCYFTASGTTTVSLGVSINRASDGKWLTSSATWSALQQVALTATDSSSPYALQGGTAVVFYQSASDAVLYTYQVANALPFWTQCPANPLIKPVPWDGFSANEVNGMMVIDDGTQFVGVSTIGNATPQEAVTFFTCPYSGKGLTWTQVTGSTIAPTGTNYGYECCGLCLYSDGYVYMSLEYAASAFTNTTISIWRTTPGNYLSSSWTVVCNNLVANSDNSGDPYLSINASGAMVLTYHRLNSRIVQRSSMTPSSAASWSGETTLVTKPSTIYAIGNPSQFITGHNTTLVPPGSTCLTTVYLPYVGSNGWVMMLFDPTGGSNYQTWGPIIGPISANHWESVSTYCSELAVLNLRDGNGAIPQGYFFGSPNNSGADNTMGEVGLTSLFSPAISSGSGLLLAAPVP